MTPVDQGPAVTAAANTLQGHEGGVVTP